MNKMRRQFCKMNIVLRSLWYMPPPILVSFLSSPSAGRVNSFIDFCHLKFLVDRASQQIRNGNSGYSSEPEATNHNSDKIAAKYATLDRRRNQSKENDASLSYVPRTK